MQCGSHPVVFFCFDSNVVYNKNYVFYIFLITAVLWYYSYNYVHGKIIIFQLYFHFFIDVFIVDNKEHKHEYGFIRFLYNNPFQTRQHFKSSYTSHNKKNICEPQVVHIAVSGSKV